MEKSKIYVIGHPEHADRVRSAAKYYISMEECEVRCNPYFGTKESARHMKNLMWADQVYIIPDMDGTIGIGMFITKLAAKLLRKKIKQHYGERRIKSWVHNVRNSWLHH